MARVGADSAPETRLRLALEQAGLPEPQLNVRTELSSGVVRQPDLGYSEQRVAAEYEGEGHSGAEQIVRDIAREEDYSRAGWLLVRISKRHMRNDARAAIAKVRAALLSRDWGKEERYSRRRWRVSGEKNAIHRTDRTTSPPARANDVARPSCGQK